MTIETFRGMLKEELKDRHEDPSANDCGTQPSVEFKIVAWGTDEYQATVKLRETILRKPLGLSFSQEDLEKERHQLHIAAFLGGELIASLVLVPDGDHIKMQRVAVAASQQRCGIGGKMLLFCEEYARKHGFKSIYCNSRDNAVEFYTKHGYVGEGEYFLESTLKILHLKMRKILS